MRAKKGFWNWQGQLSERKWKLFYNEIPVSNSTVYIRRRDQIQKQNKKQRIDTLSKYTFREK